MKEKFPFAIVLFGLATLSYAGLFDCTSKRFSRELEFKLMSECVSSNQYMYQERYQKKVAFCSCYVGSLACEYDGDDEKLFKAAESNDLSYSVKKLNKCVEKAEKKIEEQD